MHRWIDLSSAWRLHRLWLEQNAVDDLPSTGCRFVEKNALYRCLDKVLPHRRPQSHHLTEPWQDLFSDRLDVLLYDLTNPSFGFPPPEDKSDELGYGSYRDKRSDCAQVVIALNVTPEDLPLGYELPPRNTAYKTTLKRFSQQIETEYGKAERTWVMGCAFSSKRCLEHAGS